MVHPLEPARLFARIFAALAAESDRPERLMIDVTHLKANRTAASLLQKGVFPVALSAPKGRLNSKLHVACDGEGRPVLLLLTEGEMSDHRGAAMILPALPPARELLTNRGCDSNRVRTGLLTRSITSCIPSTRNRKTELPYDRSALPAALSHREHVRPRQRLRRIATRYDRCAHTLLLGNLHRSDPHILTHVVSPEPSQGFNTNKETDT